MADLILTEEEKNSPLWSDLDDESLGKLVKAQILNISTASRQAKRITIISTVTMLACMVAETNADNASFEVENVRNKTNDFGNWKITVKRRS